MFIQKIYSRLIKQTKNPKKKLKNKNPKKREFCVEQNNNHFYTCTNNMINNVKANNMYLTLVIGLKIFSIYFTDLSLTLLLNTLISIQKICHAIYLIFSSYCISNM